MTESTELLAFERQKDGYKVTVKISLYICVDLSWDELKVRQNLLVCDYKIYIVFLLVTTGISGHKSLQFVKTLTLFVSDFIRPVNCFGYYITLGYYFLPEAQVFTLCPFISEAGHAIIDTNTNEYLPCTQTLNFSAFAEILIVF